ncbi:MAG TPA: hypothetical protein ENK18_22250 [Deltaproteobacteria bacterium]|nr:hypothetical protein [Deltaproteobacteria bacterium]
MLSVIVLLHGAAVFGSLLSRWPVGRAVRAWTEPWEKVLGVHQNWPMFAYAPRQTTWVELIGHREDGTQVPIPLLPGELEPGWFMTGYVRAGKLQRNAEPERRERLRMALVRWSCRHQVAQGDPVRRVSVIGAERQTPAPGTYQLPRSDWPVNREDLGRWNCPKR